MFGQRKWRPVDYHCHLDLYPKHANLFYECNRDEIITLGVTTTPKAWPENLKLSAGKPNIRSALGLHPQLVGERPLDFPIWEKYVIQAKFIGEVGIDAGQNFVATIEKQKQIFEKILKRCAEIGGKILSVHSNRSSEIVLSMIEKFFPSHCGRIILHWFTGSKAEAKKAIELGCYFSVNSKMIQKDSQRRFVAEIPLERLLTETDGPFIDFENRPSRPHDVINTVRTISLIRQMSFDELGLQIEKNVNVLENSG